MRPSDRALNLIYWTLPLLLTGVQYWVSAASMHQIRYEELAESVRNVFWLSHRLVYDGASSNVGWYGTLPILYKFFGFSLYSAKFVRLGLHFLGLTCAADILRRCMGVRTACPTRRNRPITNLTLLEFSPNELWDRPAIRRDLPLAITFCASGFACGT